MSDRKKFPIMNVQTHKTDFNNFFMQARSDYLNFLINEHLGRSYAGSNLFLIKLTLEKLLKSILYKFDPKKYSLENLSKSPYKHNIKFIWYEIKSLYNKQSKERKYLNIFEDIVLSINNITADTRYHTVSISGTSNDYMEKLLLFTFLCYLADDYEKSYYGFHINTFDTSSYTKKTSLYYPILEHIKKILHLFFEHGIMFLNKPFTGAYLTHREYDDIRNTLKANINTFNNSCPYCIKKINDIDFKPNLSLGNVHNQWTLFEQKILKELFEFFKKES